jgi:hypothetical protein
MDFIRGFAVFLVPGPPDSFRYRMPWGRIMPQRSLRLLKQRLLFAANDLFMFSFLLPERSPVISDGPCVIGPKGFLEL